uniref:phosphatidylinositol-3,5-bisphosphate 3-phosphatase n=1 Tax=Panstrongylus lignarius TaxID=156445 RepID=A0A224X8Q9_9HEMI
MDLIKTPKVENVRMLDRYNSRKNFEGTLYVTATHLIFVDPINNKETWILHMQIATVEKLPLTTTGSPLLVRCKTFRSATFVIPRERDCHEVYTTLLQLSQPTDIQELYCFRYTSSSEAIPKTAGWNFFDLQAEYQRMKVPNEHWCLTLLNQDYELCDTYPSYLYVPATATQAILVGSSKFRSKGRLPVLTYLHKNKAAICRCSQPLSGFSARCMEDEQMLNCIVATNPRSQNMIVVDTRPRINAMANRATGKGYENENFYENIKFHFLGVENIHVMRSSLTKLIDTCELKNPTMSAFLSGLEASGWLKHIKSILDTSWFIAQAVQSGVTVLVHCSDGWDRTAQVCSLAALFLDPYYRTIQGIQALVEKDWLSFGHKFTDRVGHMAGDPKEVSPVFTQFIDSIWQLYQQAPAAFQFNERFLLLLHDHVSSCQFGTFIGNSEKERRDLCLSDRTFSLWGYMANHTKEYYNCLYNPEACDEILKPSLAPQTIKFWRGMYCRFEEGIHPRESVSELLRVANDHSSSLEDHIKLLQKRITSLKGLLSERGAKKEDKSDKVTVSFSPDKEDGTLKNALDETINIKTAKVTDKKPSPMEPPGLDVMSLALDWKSFRNVKECSCATRFDHSTWKYHCWECGEVLCTRCIDKNIKLPGHLYLGVVPVCQPCHNRITRTSSVDVPN